jgi:uncharacterized repeat protein (TIGR03833 family)
MRSHLQKERAAIIGVIRRGDGAVNGADTQVFWGKIHEGDSMDGKNRSAIQPGLKVAIVLKEDQRTGRRTEGIVQDLLTNSPTHPHGIKVRLTSGLVGRVQEILSDG